MVQQYSDNDTDIKFELPRDCKKMRKILYDYEEVLTVLLVGIEQCEEEYLSCFYKYKGKGMHDDLSTCLELMTQARYIMTFIQEEIDWVCGRLNLKIKSLPILTKCVSSYFGNPHVGLRLVNCEFRTKTHDIL